MASPLFGVLKKRIKPEFKEIIHQMAREQLANPKPFQTTKDLKFPITLPAVGRIKERIIFDYQEYRKSGHWRLLRKKALERLGRKCSVCGSIDEQKMTVHHLSYRNLGQERSDEVVVMCQDCHEYFHFCVWYRLSTIDW